MTTLEKLIQLSRDKLTPEERQKRHDKFKNLMDQRDLEIVERNRCVTCGVDTLNYSHMFDCPRRGAGY